MKAIMTGKKGGSQERTFRISLTEEEAIFLTRFFGPFPKDELLEIARDLKVKELLKNKGIDIFYNWWFELDSLLKE